MGSRVIALTSLLAGLSVAADPPALTCTPSKPVALNTETITVRAWAAGTWTFAWSAAMGELISKGSTAIWDLSDVPSGLHAVKVIASSSGAEPLQCAVRVFVERSVDSRGDLLTRRFTLSPNDDEPAGYGLYSYLLLTPDGGDTRARERNRKAIEIWKNRIIAANALERKLKRAELNATFVPLNQPPKDEPDVEWILAHYDFNRADRILAAVAAKRPGGPYLVACKQPIHGPSAQPPLLILDASWAPPSTIPLWVNAFMNQASQENFFQPRAFDMFNLKLRTIISVFAEEVPEAIGSIIAVLR